MIICNNSITTIIINGKIVAIYSLINYTCIIIVIATIQISYMANTNVLAVFIKCTTTFVFVIQSISFIILNIIPGCTIL